MDAAPGKDVAPRKGEKKKKSKSSKRSAAAAAPTGGAPAPAEPVVAVPVAERKTPADPDKKGPKKKSSKKSSRTRPGVPPGLPETTNHDVSERPASRAGSGGRRQQGRAPSRPEVDEPEPAARVEAPVPVQAQGLSVRWLGRVAWVFGGVYGWCDLNHGWVRAGGRFRCRCPNGRRLLGMFSR